MKLKNYVLVACLAMLAFPAFATNNNNPPNPCGNHGNNCDPTTPIPGGDQSQQQDQNQHQSNEQGQGQAQTATGTGTGIAVAGGGDASATGGNAQGGAGGNATSGSLSGAISGSQSGAASQVGDTAASSDNAVSTRVDASNNSRYTSQALLLPSNPVTVPIGIAGSNVTVYYGVCGPLKAIESEKVVGTYIGLFRKHAIDLGRTDRIVPYQGGEYVERSYPDGSTRLFGHQAVRTVAVVSVAGGRSLSLGGGQTGGGWGQAGAGGSSAMQQVVNQIDLEPCEAFHSAPRASMIEFAEPRVPRG